MGSKKDGRLASSLGDASLPSSFINLSFIELPKAAVHTWHLSIPFPRRTTALIAPVCIRRVTRGTFSELYGSLAFHCSRSICSIVRLPSAVVSHTLARAAMGNSCNTKSMAVRRVLKWRSCGRPSSLVCAT